jgi:hypothetical protein
MWKLTIYQKFCFTNRDGEKDERLAGEHPVSFEANCVDKLFDIIGAMASADATDITRYEIKKVVD